MSGMLEVVGVNALGATLLAGVVAAATRLVTQPAVVHGLWLLVLVELVSLPVFAVVVLHAPARAIAPAGPATAAAESVTLIPWLAIVTASCNEARIQWEDEGLKGLYDEFLATRSQP